MNLYFLDENFKSIILLDTYESFIWTERYIGYGNFEIYTPIDEKVMMISEFIQTQRKNDKDCYIWRKNADQLMIVEDTEIKTEVETGNRLIVSGRSLESLLERRIIWKQTILNGNLQNSIKKLLDENAINPTDSNRKIPGLIFQSSINKVITDLTIQAQFTGDNLYETISSICTLFNIGFRIFLDSQFRFVFELYAGEDRSYDQLLNPAVVFSPKFENIINSRFYESSTTTKTVALVGGEGEGVDRRTRTVGGGSGLGRREIFVDARDIQSETEDGKIPDSEYNAQLDQRGREKLAENVYTMLFEGEIEATKTFIYNRDFYKGDVVQMLNEYGISAKVRIMEIVLSEDATGVNIYPTFSIVD